MASPLHLASHYEVAEAMFRPYWTLIQKLNKTEIYFKGIGDEVIPYPHGCAPCKSDMITNAFKRSRCKLVFEFMERSGHRHLKCGPQFLKEETEHCCVPFLMHGAVHCAKKKGLFCDSAI